MVFPTINQGQDYIDRGLQSDEERAREGEARGPIGSSEDSFFRICSPIAQLQEAVGLGAHKAKIGPSERIFAGFAAP